MINSIGFSVKKSFLSFLKDFLPCIIVLGCSLCCFLALLNISLYPSVALKVCAEKSTDSLMDHFLSVASCFSLVAFKIVFSFFSVSQHGFLWVHII